jgi:hypothetical protein
LDPTHLATSKLSYAMAAARAALQAASSNGLDSSQMTIMLPCSRNDYERLLVLLASLHHFLDPTVRRPTSSDVHLLLHTL